MNIPIARLHGPQMIPRTHLPHVTPLPRTGGQQAIPPIGGMATGTARVVGIIGYDAPMKMWIVAVALCGSALVVGGCSTSPDSPVVSSPAASTASFSITSWETFGQAGQKWLAKCSSTIDWKCINQQAMALQSAGSLLPQDETHSSVLRVVDSYRRDYSKFVELGCEDDESTLPCQVKVTHLRLSSGNITSALNNLAAGKPAS